MALPFQRVALVDDDQFLLDMYQTKFKGEGVEVLPFPSTKKALRAFEEGKAQADVVLIDMVMPEMDGVAFLKALRRLPQGKDIVSIMLTNQGQDTDRAQAMEAGADGFLVKANLTPTQVVKEVARIVEEKRKGKGSEGA